MNGGALDADDTPTPVLAAAALLGHPVPESAAKRLRTLERDGMQVTVADAHGRALLDVADDVAAHPDSQTPPPLLTTSKHRRALVAALAACRAADGSLYPGRPARVDDVVALTRPTSAPAGRHIRGALDDLAALGLIDINNDVVTAGPQLAAWTARRHQQDLAEVLDRLQPKDTP